MNKSKLDQPAGQMSSDCCLLVVTCYSLFFVVGCLLPVVCLCLVFVHFCFVCCCLLCVCVICGLLFVFDFRLFVFVIITCYWLIICLYVLLDFVVL